MSTVNNKLTNLADEIRVLSGTTEPLGLDAMASNVADANTTIDAQATTIDEIAALLEGKSIPGGGASGGGTSIDTCTFEYYTRNGYSSNDYCTGLAVQVINADGVIDIVCYREQAAGTTVTIENALCGGLVATYCGDTAPVCSGVELLASANGIRYYKITVAAGEIATLEGEQI